MWRLLQKRALTRVVKDQQQTIATQKATFQQREQAIAEQQQALDQRAAMIKEISERVAKLESLMQNGK